jgi:hypothetical protein
MHRSNVLAAFAPLVAALFSGRPAQAADSAHFKQTAPANLAVIPQGTTSVTFSFQIDWAGLKAQYGPGAKVGLSVFFPCCYGGIPLGDFVAEGETSKSYTVAAISQAMTQHGVPTDSPIAWTLDLHFVPQQSERAQSTFFINPPHRPGPRYTPSLAPDSPSAWPTKFVVTNDGDALSQPSSLAVRVKLLPSGAPVPRGACEPRFSDFTRDVPALAPGARFDVPPIEFHLGPLAGKLQLPTPATSAPATPAAPPMSKVTPRIACRFEIKAETGPPPRTAGPRPVGVFGSLARTITIYEQVP